MARVDAAWKTASTSPGAAGFRDDVVDAVILEVETDRGVGLGGSAASKAISPEDLYAAIDGPIRSLLVGADSLSGTPIRECLREQGLSPRATIVADLALHDLLGKVANLPCHVLWGGAVRSVLSVVRMVGLKAPAELEAAIASLTDEGYTHFKIKVGSGLRDDLARIRRVREVFGADIWISVDGNGAYTPDDAIALSHALEPYDVRLIEQPIAYDDVEGMVRVTAASSIPIMADQSVYDAQSALAICRRKAAHVVSVKLLKMGSIDQARRVTELCQTFGVGVHIGGTAAPAVVDAAQVQLAATMPWIAPQCEVGEFLSVMSSPLVGLDVRGGQVRLSEAPGLGIALGEESTTTDDSR